MKRNFRLNVFILIFFLCLFLPKLEAAQELPLNNPEMLISMDFQDANLKDILKILSVQSGLNFIASDSVKDRKFTLYFDNVSIKEAMDKIFSANNLSYDIDKKSNIFVITDLGAPETKTVTKFFQLKYASVSGSQLILEKGTVGADDSSTGATGSGGGGGSGGITDIITKMLSDKGKVIEDPRTNSLIVTDTPTRVEIITDMLVKLDVPQPQILLEVEMLDVDKNDTEKIGLKYGTSPLTLTSVMYGASWGSKFPFGSIFGKDTLNFANGSFGLNANTPSTYQVVLDFLAAQTGTKFLARPKILTLNNETAEIKIEADTAIGVTTTTSSNAGTTQASPERAKTGVSLRVTPQLNMDTGEITMYIVPKVSEAVTGGTFNISSNTSVTYKDPEDRYTKSMVRVKDGETVVLGGLIRRKKSEIITKLPFLGDIPFLGAAFRHKDVTEDKDRELLVFITPHLIKDSSDPKTLQAKKTTIPNREQSTVTSIDRQATINESLKKFEQKAE